MMKKYFAEFVGTFALSFVVLVALASTNAPIVVPVIAGLTLALFFYSIGPISGCHINPSVTLGQLSLKKISQKDAVYYILAQALGAVVAILIAKMLQITALPIPSTLSFKVFFAEMLGAFFFNFGVASVVYGKAKEDAAGFVVGGSLLLGILISSLSGAAGILNPAVALALNSLTVVYLFAPILGAVLGVQVYRYIAGER